jgi:hypothetical protein
VHRGPLPGPLRRSEPLPRHLDRLRVDVDADELAADVEGGDSSCAGAHERVEDRVAGARPCPMHFAARSTGMIDVCPPWLRFSLGIDETLLGCRFPDAARRARRSGSAECHDGARLVLAGFRARLPAVELPGRVLLDRLRVGAQQPPRYEPLEREAP